nr:MAG TPA: hypothetical protein [Bacteriophage sp.]
MYTRAIKAIKKDQSSNGVGAPRIGLKHLLHKPYPMGKKLMKYSRSYTSALLHNKCCIVKRFC